MLIPIFGGFFLGGLFCGIFLSVKYRALIARQLSRPSWSVTLQWGWLLYLTGIVLFIWSFFTPQKNYSWQDGWGNGFQGIGLCLWWITLFRYLRWRKTLPIDRGHEIQRPTQPSEGVWPPPPNDGH